MLQVRLTGVFGCLVWLGLLVAMVMGAGGASAQDRRQNAPGEFDFYVLSLSWSPSFCEEAAERGTEARSRRNAEAGRFRSWSMASGRNTSAAFPNIASAPRPGSNATSCPRCWT